jgi:hypothetical protein
MLSVNRGVTGSIPHGLAWRRLLHRRRPRMSTGRSGFARCVRGVEYFCSLFRQRSTRVRRRCRRCSCVCREVSKSYGGTTVASSSAIPFSKPRRCRPYRNRLISPVVLIRCRGGGGRFGIVDARTRRINLWEIHRHGWQQVNTMLRTRRYILWQALPQAS